MRMARCRKTGAVCVTTVLLLAGCGGDGDSASPTTAPNTSTTISQVELDKQKAPRVVLTAADVPGFTQDPPDPNDEDDASIEAAANACLNNDPLLLRLGEDDDPRGTSSPEFSRGETATVYSAVTFGQTDDEARASMTALGASSFPGCFSDALTTALREEQTFTNVTVSTTRLPAITAGDQSLGFRSTVRARASGQPVTFYIDFTFIRSGRVLSVLSGFGFGAPFPEADRSRLATTIAGRMAAP